MSQRLDKWLFFARLAKHRSTAVALIEQGAVRINRQPALKPAANVRVGDVLTLALPGGVRVLAVREEGSRRGPFSEACQLYEEISPSA